MPELLNTLTFCWLLLLAIRSALALQRGEVDSIHFVFIVFFVFMGIPPLLDLALGPPEYPARRGFYVASRDVTTSFLYCAYVSMVPLVWIRYGRRQRERKKGKNSAGSRSAVPAQATARAPQPEFPRGPEPPPPSIQVPQRGLGLAASATRGRSPGRPSMRWTVLLHTLLMAPVFFLPWAPEPSLYLTYAVAPRGLLPDVVAQDYHNYLNLLCSLSLLSAVVLVARQRRLLDMFLYVLPWLAADVWLQGKRGIVFMGSLLFAYVFWWRGVLVGSRLVVAVLAGVVSLAVFSNAYVSTVREASIQTVGFDLIYERVRIDYGRDDVIKTAIFAELNPNEMRILEHRGQSMLFYATMYVPRRLWPEKPLPYAQYLTSAVLYDSPEARGWGFTTSILDEALANFGWLGMLIAPLVIAFVCRYGDGATSIHARMLTSLIACLFLVVHLVAFAPIFLVWVVVTTMEKRALRDRARRATRGRM